MIYEGVYKGHGHTGRFKANINICYVEVDLIWKCSGCHVT